MIITPLVLCILLGVLLGVLPGVFVRCFLLENKYRRYFKKGKIKQLGYHQSMIPTRYLVAKLDCSRLEELSNLTM